MTRGAAIGNAAVALQTVISQQNRGWQVELVQFQELTDHLDVLSQVTGIRIQEQYNTLLRNGWTLVRRNCFAFCRRRSGFSRTAGEFAGRLFSEKVNGDCWCL